MQQHHVLRRTNLLRNRTSGSGSVASRVGQVARGPIDSFELASGSESSVEAGMPWRRSRDARRDTPSREPKAMVGESSDELDLCQG